MGNYNSVPVVSQVKSLTEFIAGDSAAALQTQKDFAYNNTFPVISQIASAGMAIDGNLEGAKDLQEKFAKDMERVIATIPVAGHIQGGVYYALGDKEKGEEAMKSASRSTGVLAGGVAGFVMGGPVGAMAGGVAGGAAADAIITKSDELAKGKDMAQDYGYMKAAKEIDKAIHGDSKISVDQAFDMAMLPVSDAVGGYVAGEAIGKPLAGGIEAGAEKTAASAAGDGPKVQIQGKPKPNMDIDITAPVKPKVAMDKAALDNRANQLNPEHVKSGPGRPAGYRGAKTKADLDNHANQMNPNNPRYAGSKNANANTGGIVVNPAAAQEGSKGPSVNNDKLKKGAEAGNTMQALKSAGQGVLSATGFVATVFGSFWTATIALISLLILVLTTVVGICSCIRKLRFRRRNRGGYTPFDDDEEQAIPVARLSPESRSGYAEINGENVIV